MSAAISLNRLDKIIKINISALKKFFVELIRNNNIFYYTASPKIVIKLADENIIIFINIGSETNIINNKKINNRGLITTRGFCIKIIDINRGSIIIINIVKNTIINTNSVGVLKNFIIIKNFSYPLILGIPFNIKI